MKQYIKNIMILILALPWGLLLTNCSDSKSDYSDDNAYPPPTVELTSPSEIDVVEYIRGEKRCVSKFGRSENI